MSMKIYNVALLTSRKWIHRTTSNRFLIAKMEKAGIMGSEVCWDEGEQKQWEYFDCVLICNTWGYEENWKKYLAVLQEIERKTLLCNPYTVVRDNIYKEYQFMSLKRLGIPFIESAFISESKFGGNENVLLLSDIADLVAYIRELLDCNKFVVKPNISASGKNTFVFGNTETCLNGMKSQAELLDYCHRVFKKGLIVMAQPYVSGIKNGEYALIYLNQRFSHAILRYPGIFYPHQPARLLDEVPENIMELAECVVKKMTGDNCLYMRIDIVLDKGVAKIMEIECNEPELYFYCLDQKQRNEAVSCIIRGIMDKVQASDGGQHI